jgi:hypothetical protein
MNKYKQIKLVILFFTGVCFSLLLLIHPVNAKISSNAPVINLNLINDVNQSLKLNSIPKKIEQPLLISGFIESMYQVQQELAQDLSSNEALAIDLGTNAPVRIGLLPDSGQLANNNYMAVGYMGLSGSPQPITGNQILKMVGSLIALNEMNNQTDRLIGGNGLLGGLARSIVRDVNREVVKGLVDTSLNLIVYNSQDRNLYLAEQTNANALLRDAMNAVLNHTVKKVDFAGIGIPQIRIRPNLF